MKLCYFNFKQINGQYLLTNDFGRYLFLSPDEFKKLVSDKYDNDSELCRKLKDSHMAYDESDIEYSGKYKYELREFKNQVNVATSLHIFVVTTACNMNCVYCQANNGKNCSNLMMTNDIAEKAVDIALQSPSINLSFEFQGGEPLLNFDVIKHIVEYTEENKGIHKVEYNLVSNLTLLTDEILDWLIAYRFGVSTSLDGPLLIHDKNRRLLNGQGTFRILEKKIDKIRQKGLYVGAIETTTRASLQEPEELVDTYVSMGFKSIFLRPLTPLGRALVNWNEIGYTPKEFINFYKRATERMIEINQDDCCFIKEDHAAMFINRIKGGFVNYMELRSPCGAGIGQLAYYADGNVFTCDEGRMLSEMGNDAFKLGNVFEDNYVSIVSNSICKTVCLSSILESIPSCCDCVYQPYCGTCPVVNYALDGDVIEKQPRGYKCQIYCGILDFLFSKLLENNSETVDILNSWSE